MAPSQLNGPDFIALQVSDRAVERRVISMIDTFEVRAGKRVELIQRLTDGLVAPLRHSETTPTLCQRSDT